MKRLLLLCSGVVALGFFKPAAAAPLGLRIALWSRSASQGQGEDPGPSKTFGDYLNWPGQEFATDGDAEWTFTDVEPDGLSSDGYALRSGVITHNQESWLRTEVSGEGTISFWCRVEGEVGVGGQVWDGLAFYVDGYDRSGLMGNSQWQHMSFAITNSGVHTLAWVYKKDGSVTGSGEDCAWLDRLVWTPSSSNPSTPEEVAQAIEAVGFADEDAIKEVIGGSATEYAKFKEWASAVYDTDGWDKAGEEAVANAPYVAAAYVLGAEKLFVNEPVIEIQRLKVDSSDSGGGVPSSDGMSVRVVVWDGDYPVTCVPEKVAQLFEATGDLGDWDGDAKLGTSVTVESVMGREMNFKVVPGDGTAPRAFLRLRK